MEDKVLETVVNSVKFTFEKDFLVKPLEPTMIKRKYTEQVPNGKKDEEGNNLYDTKEVVKEEESDFEKGIVISIPTVYDGSITCGNTVVYPKKFAKEFDLFKDSKLVKTYDIVAIEKK
mgnify:FL=1|jgi:hypothetical protein|nr:MAG TPA: hypothetical protein [Bacteriophage sp.]